MNGDFSWMNIAVRRNDQRFWPLRHVGEAVEQAGESKTAVGTGRQFRFRTGGVLLAIFQYILQLVQRRTGSENANSFE